jgi:phage baseplate assembly protein V
MTELSKLHRLLENLIRFGIVAEVQHQPPRVKVRTGSLTTAWLPWIADRAGADQPWDPPTEGEQVLLLTPSGQLANGVAVTGLLSDAIPANGERTGLHRRTYRDGAVIEYDSVAHHLNVVLPNGGTTRLTSTGDIRITGPIFHEGDYTQTGKIHADRQPADRGRSGGLRRCRSRRRRRRRQPSGSHAWGRERDRTRLAHQRPLHEPHHGWWGCSSTR